MARKRDAPRNTAQTDQNDQTTCYAPRSSLVPSAVLTRSSLRRNSLRMEIARSLVFEIPRVQPTRAKRAVANPVSSGHPKKFHALEEPFE